MSSQYKSNSSTTDMSASGPLSPLISREVVQVILYLSIFLALGLGMVGTTFNAINITVFLKLGAKDCVSICLLSLAITDVSFLAFAVVAGVCNLMEALQVYLYVDHMAVYYLVVYISAMAYDMSSYITAFISLERCLCVALPFHFKDLFTFNRAVFAVIFICVFTIGCYLPHFVTSGVGPSFDPRTNSTRILVWYSENTPAVAAFLNLWNHLILSVTSLVIVMVSTQVMVRSLYKSSQFQNKGASNIPKPAPSSGEERPQISPDEIVVAKEAHQKEKSKNSSKLSVKNLRVVKMVSTLAIICIVCNTSRFLLVTALRIEPEIMFGRRYHNTYFVILNSTFVCQLINASSNIFVYLKLNPSYRNMFSAIFGSGPSK